MQYQCSTVERRWQAREQAFCFTLLLAFLDWQTGSEWLPLVLLLFFAFVLGLNHPRDMPCGVLLIGVYIPASHLLATAVGLPVPHPLSVSASLLGVPGAFLGAHSGAAVARLAHRFGDLARSRGPRLRPQGDF